MKKRTGAILMLVLFGGLMLGLTVWDILTPDRLFSQYENRILAGKPKFDVSALFAGTLSEDYESYVTDQFVGRDNWVYLKTVTDVALGKKEINGVYLAKDGTLIEKHTTEEISPETVQKRLALLEKLVGWQQEREAITESEDAAWSGAIVDADDAATYTSGADTKGVGSGSLYIMLVPTADNILSEKLPNYADYFKQQDFLTQVTQTVTDERVINVWDALEAHKDENIYYGTDHHWTTLGAYYGYTAWAEKAGVTHVLYNTETVSESFFGTLHSKTHLPVEPDSIEAYVGSGLLQSWLSEDGSKSQTFPGGQDGTGLQVYYDFSEESKSSLYEPDYLDTKNQYGFFLDDNHPFVRIETATETPEAVGRSIFIIKDSYANCFIPFLTSHYETIYVLDPRYYRGRLFPLLEECAGDNTMDVLVLYNVIHFIDEFQYY